MVAGNIKLVVFAGMKSTRRVSWKRVATVVLVTVFYYISYTPYVIMEIILSSEPGTVPPPLHSSYHLPATLCWQFCALACWINVLVYLGTNERFRDFTAETFRVRQRKSGKVFPLSVNSKNTSQSKRAWSMMSNPTATNLHSYNCRCVKSQSVRCTKMTDFTVTKLSIGQIS